MNITVMLILCILVAAAAFSYAAWLFKWVKTQPQDNKTIEKVCGLIQDGARTFLNKQNQILIGFAGIVAVLILLFLPKPIWQSSFSENLLNAIAYLGGTLLSAFSGKIGIEVATIANGRSAIAAKKDLKSSFMVGFRGGAVMGMAVVGACVLGVAVVYLLTGNTQTVLCFSLGASSLALFAKVGGGIFTKTADIAADLTGKVELGIPEDDPRNPAVIADNVGDNVGDVAGMGADLFDSNVASLAAALVIAQKLDMSSAYHNNVLTVFCYAGLGLLASLIGVMQARIGKNGNPTSALNSSTYVTTFIYAILTALATAVFGFSWRIWGACVLGLLVGVVIGITTDYFTDDTRKPVHNVAHASKSGPAFTILSGISYGFLSALPALVGTGISTMISYKLCEGIDPALSSEYALFGISIAAVGMLSIVGMIVSNDAYGPIVDNARGLAEMGGLGDEVLEITDELDSAGNTVKAITKGFSISAAGLTVIALLGTFMSEVNDAAALLGVEKLNGFDVMDPLVFFGMLVGAAIPAVFSAMLILGVDRNAQRMVEEIHRQFNTIEGLKEGRADPEYNKCIDIATSGAIKELIPAGLSAILSTIAVGIIGGVKAIGGFLVGNILSGLLLSLFMSAYGIMPRNMWKPATKAARAPKHIGLPWSAIRSAIRSKIPPVLPSTPRSLSSL